MTSSSEEELGKIYLASRSTVDTDTWNGIIASCAEGLEPERLPDELALQMGDSGLPDFLPDLARLEWAVHTVKNGEIEIPVAVEQLGVNPTVQLLQLSWKNLCSILNSDGDPPYTNPEPGEEFVLIWLDPKTLRVKTQPASDEDLLVLKMVVEGIDPQDAAVAGGLPVGAVDEQFIAPFPRGFFFSPVHLFDGTQPAFLLERTQTRFSCRPRSLHFSGT